MALVVLVVLAAFVPVLDDAGAGHVDDALRRALVGYGIARGLNGAISVAQGTEVAVQPAGVGVNFAPGEILDPVNDLIERFSGIMLLAASSLGIQKVLLSMSAWLPLAFAVAASGLAWLGLLSLRRPGERSNAAVIAGRVFLFIALLRFVMPVISIANDQVYRIFLEADYAEASAGLERVRVEIGEIDEVAPGEALDEAAGAADADPGLVERARAMYRRTVASVDIERKLAEYRAAAESISENTIRLIVVFLMQTMVFPLLFLFVAWGLLKRMTRF